MDECGDPAGKLDCSRYRGGDAIGTVYHVESEASTHAVRHWDAALRPFRGPTRGVCVACAWAVWLPRGIRACASAPAVVYRPLPFAPPQDSPSA